MLQVREVSSPTTKKIAKMISGSFGAFLFCFSFSPFFGGGSNFKAGAGGWILDFAGDVVISRGARSSWSLLL